KKTAFSSVSKSHKPGLAGIREETRADDDGDQNSEQDRAGAKQSSACAYRVRPARLLDPVRSKSGQQRKSKQRCHDEFDRIARQADRGKGALDQHVNKALFTKGQQQAKKGDPRQPPETWRSHFPN